MGKEFDVEVYKNKQLFLAIEVKSLSSSEFNIENISNGIGKLSKSNCQWKNEHGDGVGQLRAYCVNWNKLNRDSIPILTNGKEWVLFNLSSFINRVTLCQNIHDNMILGRAKITDDCFYDSIIKKIKNI